LISAARPTGAIRDVHEDALRGGCFVDELTTRQTDLR
jgi:hypothetical protein